MLVHIWLERDWSGFIMVVRGWARPRIPAHGLKFPLVTNRVGITQAFLLAGEGRGVGIRSCQLSSIIPVRVL